ncbi:MAG TPA: penicillin-binding transpeptidase domain-containing protein, partial [Candidatus Angelobacter sp.]|nr:penicillin-binding transpeptidase domain-containing protein [Candidatus Angelobacter sp.]
EVSGVMPSEEWKMKNFRQKWYAGEVISVGIGQGAVAVSPIQMARTIGGIAMGGTFYRPHVVKPEDLPKDPNRTGADVPDVVHVPIDPKNWITITDAMAAVLNPGGTGVASHLQGVDFAGKTGSTQRVSHKYLETHHLKTSALSDELKGNGWFAGVTPRRNPEIVVVVYFEGGEHGPLAARIASQVIKTYVDKQRQVRNNPMLFSDKNDPGSVPMASLWSVPAEGEEDATAEALSQAHIRGGTLRVKMEGPKGSKFPAKTRRAVAVGGEN